MLLLRCVPLLPCALTLRCVLALALLLPGVPARAQVPITASAQAPARAGATARVETLAHAPAQTPAPGTPPARAADPALQHSVEELRHIVGTWDVTTDFLRADGAVARTVTGTYEFTWVVPDRVVSGVSRIPELGTAAGLLLYVSEERKVVEMVSVGADGQLFVMTGDLGSDARITPETRTPTGTTRLRFTRSGVTPSSFESRMDYTNNGGATWTPGNRQRFVRRG
ncbi:MAG: hypothetical protein AB7G23_09415 [Vicinamibacterales bacterium]